MGRPGENELASAFQEAKRLIWKEKDQFFLAKSLFALHDRWDELSKILTACDAYLRSGQSTTAHRKLVSTMNAYRNIYSEENSDFIVSVSDEELKIALEQAELLREQDNDEQFIGKTILNLNDLVKKLESVQRATERYFHSGTSEREKIQLETAIKQYRMAESRSASADYPSLGLI